MPASARFCKGNDMLVTWVGICCLLAVILSFEDHFQPERGTAKVDPGLKLIMYIMLAGAIAAQTDTVRGFFIVWLSSIGGYRVTKLFFGWFLHAVGFKYHWQGWRS